VRLDPADVVDPATRLTLAQTGLIERGKLLREIAERRQRMPGEAREGAREPATAVERGSAAAGPELDPLLQTIADLRSRDATRVRRALAASPEPPPAVVAALVPLLASDELFPDVLAALRRAAPRATGQLVDVLLDGGENAVVRRRIARVLRRCATPRAAEGLVAALGDASFELRVAAASALASLHEASDVVCLARERVFEQVRRELDSGEPVDRQLPHVFALLSLTLEPHSLQIAWAAMKSSDRTLRGTALEYLNNVLPDDVFPRVRSLFGASSVVFAARNRTAAQVADELRTTATGLRIERPPWQEADGDQSDGS
jgi:AAA family ATP:ADP antiporter